MAQNTPVVSLPILTDVWGPHVSFFFNLRCFFFLHPIRWLPSAGAPPSPGSPPPARFLPLSPSSPLPLSLSPSTHIITDFFFADADDFRVMEAAKASSSSASGFSSDNYTRILTRGNDSLITTRKNRRENDRTNPLAMSRSIRCSSGWSAAEARRGKPAGNAAPPRVPSAASRHGRPVTP